MIVTKYTNIIKFDYINPWGEILTPVAWSIRESHHSKFDVSPDQIVFGIDMIFNLT